MESLIHKSLEIDLATHKKILFSRIKMNPKSFIALHSLIKYYVTYFILGSFVKASTVMFKQIQWLTLENILVGKTENV